ncbi:MAG TPA: hypothetical protein VIO60_08035 [Rectinemataceae bacterium]
MKRLLLVLVAFALILPLSAQDSGQDRGFSAGLNLGSDLLPDPDTGVIESWSKLGFRPDLAIGKFGIGLDLTLRFQLYPESSSDPIKIYKWDWIPNTAEGKTIFDVYLPKIMYVRYGLRGVDPLYAKLGSIDDFTLGNGLIINDYANTRFLPDQRIFGLQAGIDGELFNVPYFGLEALTGNLAKLDVVGGRVYLRPLAFLGKSVLGRTQLGATGVVDQDPYLYTAPGTGSLIYVLGADVTMPILTNPALSLTAYVEGAREMNESMGAIAGIGGKLIGFMKYGLQFRYLQEGFIPSYFDANYDILRDERYDFIAANPTPGAFIPSWQAFLGFDLFSDKLVFDATVSGPFDSVINDADDSTEYPHLKGSLVLKEGLISGLSLEGSYEKFFIGKGTPNTFLDKVKDLIDPTDAAIGFAVHYKTGATVLTLDYAIRWDPSLASGAGDWDVSSSLSASVRF